MSQFVDEASLHVEGGRGGAGAVSFRREAHVPRGGPDGGDGGDGGDVWMIADRDTASLLAFRDHPHRRAGDGGHGSGKRRHGSRGADLRIAVPEGTVVSDGDGQVAADLVAHGDSWLAAHGGRGGRGNARFLTNRHRAPAFAEQGEPGEARWLRLEVKLVADVALVGFPNAGKSTLISRISAAKPRIADYPFTTLEPHLGVVRAGDRELVVADIPGLVEGAAQGRGLGHRFLRHVERARVLLLLLDLSAAESPARQREVLLAEVGGYRPELLERPRTEIGTKSDVATATYDGMRVSAVTGEGVDRLVYDLSELVSGARSAEPLRTGFVVHRPAAEGVVVERGGDGSLVVRGRAAERAVALSDLTNPDALAYAHRRLRRLGVDRALARAGARPGDLVRIGGITFEYEDVADR